MKYISGFLAAASACLIGHAAIGAEHVVPNVRLCTPIKTAAQLQAMQPAGTYCLANDIDLRGIANFKPIASFNGRLFGNGHVIRNLTINTSSGTSAGFIAQMAGGLIQDLGLVNAKVTSNGQNFVGSLVGDMITTVGPVTIARVYATGQVNSANAVGTGGLIGRTLASFPITVSDSWTSVNVTGSNFTGGFIGATSIAAYQRSYAMGSVACSGTCTYVGGFGGFVIDGSFTDSYATGPVKAPNAAAPNYAGGFIGGSGALLTRCYATGPVHAGASVTAGSLIGVNGHNTAVTQSFGVGNVSGDAGATLRGLIGASTSPSMTNNYWDTVTTGQTVSPTGSGKTTAQLRAALPDGFDDNFWGITNSLSYPFLQSTNFASTLAALVSGINVFTFVPIGQSDASQYAAAPHHANAASLAAVYTMIARAVGFGANVAQLANVKIDKYFWRDATQTTFFRGPLTSRAILGPIKNLAPTARLNGTNVIGQMNAHRLVILRGAYATGTRGVTGTHWMLGTMYTKSGTTIISIIANDPWTGTQVEIDPDSRKVTSPANFPLDGFTVNGYQAVTVN